MRRQHRGCSASRMPTTRAIGQGSTSTICRAVAAAIFNDPTKVKFTPLIAKERFTALQSGEIDVLSRNTTWTMSRDTSLGLKFAGVNYYDGQGFMVNSQEAARRQLRAAASRRRLGLRADRHHDRAQPRRLLQGNNMNYKPGGLREVRGGRRRLSTQAAATPTPPTSRASMPIRLTAAGSRRPCRAAGDHLQGAARPGGSPGRRPVVQHRQMDLLRAAQRRGGRRHPGQCRRDEGRAPTRRSSACSGPSGDSSARLGLEQRLGRQHRQGGRQLRRDLRAQCRRGHARSRSPAA